MKKATRSPRDKRRLERDGFESEWYSGYDGDPFDNVSALVTRLRQPNLSETLLKFEVEIGISLRILSDESPPLYFTEDLI